MCSLFCCPNMLRPVLVCQAEYERQASEYKAFAEAYIQSARRAHEKAIKESQEEWEAECDKVRQLWLEFVAEAGRRHDRRVKRALKEFEAESAQQELALRLQAEASEKKYFEDLEQVTVRVDHCTHPEMILGAP